MSVDEGSIPADYSVVPCPECGEAVTSYRLTIDHPAPVTVGYMTQRGPSTVTQRSVHPCGHVVPAVFFDYKKKVVSWE